MTAPVKRNGFLKIYDIVRQREFLHASIHTNIGYTHYMVADGLRGFIRALGWKWITDGSYDKIAKDKWME